MLNYTHPLYELFNSFGLLAKTEIALILSHFKPKSHKIGTVLVNFGEINDKIYFIEKGILREFSKQEQDNTITHWLVPENNFEYLVDSFLEQKPSDIALEVIEDAKLWEITKTDIDKLYVEFPQLNVIGRILLEENLKKYERYNAMIRQNSESRWKWFNDNYPGLANRVSVRYIATFLHMHRVTLSKIRSKRAKV
ncbi:MAG: Crp/Fnr family transcriptional regulator [Emticicia sp.]|uniref:Crp/Fnr family transcriptional regulator n=1 Tax=Emticicia sp. TaxID=1930953 RepID=UPI003BA4D5B9